MLVWILRLNILIVSVSLVLLLTFVTSATTEVGAASSGSEDLTRDATKSSYRNRSQGFVNDEGNSEKVRLGVKSITDSNIRYWNYSRMMSDAAIQEPNFRTRNPANGRNSKKKKRKNAKTDEESPDTGRSAFWSEDIQVGCKELRARRYISDGFCTSEEPIKEVACAGTCLPIMDMPWYAEFVKTVAKTKLKDWQCVENVVRKNESNCCAETVAPDTTK